MIRYYNINGQIVSASDAALKVNDLAILRGYGIFDYFLVREGVPMFLDDYVSRFFNSAQLMKLDLAFSASEVKELIHELVEVNGVPEAGIRLVLTGGYADDGYTPEHPNLLILEHPMPNIPSYENGAKVLLHGYQRELPEAKTINYVTGIRLNGEMKEKGCVEILYHDNGLIREAVRSNFFLVMPDDTVVTVGTEVLRGITRKNVLTLARQQFKVEERDITLQELKTAKEAFITSTIKSVLPIVQVGDQVIGNGKVGAVTKQLGKSLEAFAKNYIEAAKVEI
ncbi:MAG: aminotransferase class IV [Saprospiraceae bacterium]